MTSLINPENLRDLADLAAEMPPGCFVEVGVYKGGSARYLMDVANAQGRVLWLFDTFTGIPEWTEGVDSHHPHDFADTSLEQVRALVPEAQCVVGDARWTLADTDTGPVAFAHIDCDQYATTRAVIGELLPRMVRGGVLWFDDYEALASANRAIDELIDGIEWSPGHKAFKRT